VAVEVVIPKLGLTMETGVIEEWLVAPGTAVKPGDPLLRLATDKVDAEVEAEGSGLFHPAVEPGAELPPGALIGWLLEAGEEVPSGAAVLEEPPPPHIPAEAAAPVVGEPGALTRTGRLFASPNARRVAREREVDITQLNGTGPGGRIITADVLDAAARQAAAQAPASASPAAPAAAAAQAPAAQVIPLTGMRGVIASRMHASLQEMAQLTLGTEAVMDAAVALRAQLKEQWGQAGIPVPTITDLVVRAAALALREHPRLNASVHDDAIHVQPEINVGLAVALEDGLLVPVLKRADQLPLSAVAAESRRLAQGARAGRLSLPDLEGGTFTVSTLGSYGIDFFTPVITPGQVAILGVGRLRDSVRWEGPSPVRTQVMTLSITFDHRAVDGAPAADYLRSVLARLASPLSLLA